MKLKTKDVPQADLLALVRRLLEVISQFPIPVSTTAVNALIRRMLSFKPSERPTSDEVLTEIQKIRSVMRVKSPKNSGRQEFPP